MGICPLCNGFEEIHFQCPHCCSQMADEGKLMDFFDDYSPYMPIDQMKLEDGFPANKKNEQCVHLFQCPNCGFSRIQFIQE